MKRASDFRADSPCRNHGAGGTAAAAGTCHARRTPCVPSGSCAFDGAKVVLLPITDAAHLVHGPIACEGNSWEYYRSTPSSGPQLHRRSFTTDLSETDIVLGLSEKRLYASLEHIVARYAPPAIFVYTTCVTSLIGDDVALVCREASARLGTACIAVDSAGFKGSRNWGARSAARTLLEQVIGTREPDVATDLDINLIGEFNQCGEFWQVKPLFETLGIRVHTCLTGDSRYNDIASCHRVRANFVVCSASMINLAEELRDRYGIPFYEGSFYGIQNTSNALRMITQLLVERGASPALQARTESLIAREEARTRARLTPYVAQLTDKRALLHTGGYKSWSMISALQEAGLTVMGSTLHKATDHDKARAVSLLHPPANTYQTVPMDLSTRLRELQIDVLVSGERLQFTAHAANVAWLDINHGRSYGYAGYEGSVQLAQHLAHEVGHPLWKQLQYPAPWA